MITYKFSDGTTVNKIQVSPEIIVEIKKENLEECLGAVMASLLGKELIEVYHEE